MFDVFKFDVEISLIFTFVDFKCIITTGDIMKVDSGIYMFRNKIMVKFILGKASTCTQGIVNIKAN